MDTVNFADPGNMPGYFFGGAIKVNHATAIRANLEKQNCGFMGTGRYMDADFICVGCKHEFTRSAREQQVWFEHYFFWVDSQPLHCIKYRSCLRHLAVLRKEYDAMIGKVRRQRSMEELKMVAMIADFEVGFEEVPEGIRETKLLFERLLKNMTERRGMNHLANSGQSRQTIPDA